MVMTYSSWIYDIWRHNEPSSSLGNPNRKLNGRGFGSNEMFLFLRGMGEKLCLNFARMFLGTVVLSANFFPQSGPWRTWLRICH